MDYDKDSFLTGIAVGRQLKGWASGGGGGERPIEPINYDMLNARIDGTLSVAVNSDVGKVAAYALASCSKLPSISLPNATEIGTSAFDECSALASAHIPAVAKIGRYAFRRSGLSEITAPAVEEVDQQAFYGCESLVAASLQVVKKLGIGTFQFCSKLHDVYAPSLQSLNAYAFRGCKSLEEINLPEATSFLSDVFENCSALKLARLPKAESFSSGVFMECEGLERILTPRVSSFGTGCFSECGSLVALVLRTSETAGLTVPAGAAYQLSSLFGGTPLGLDASGGYFYVPSSAMSKFSASAAWGPYVTAGKFRAIEDYPGVLD